MAYIGLRYPVAAPVATETPGSPLTYSSGIVLGKAIAANLTWERNDNPLYADDTIAEDDNGITGGTIEFNADDLDDDQRELALGLVAEMSSGQTPTKTGVYKMTDAAAPYVGFGFIRVRRKAGTTSYQAVWICKVQFSENNENAQTKGQSIEWGTPTLNGRIMGVQEDNSGAILYRKHKLCTAEADAKAWLNGLAGISTGGTT